MDNGWASQGEKYSNYEGYASSDVISVMTLENRISDYRTRQEPLHEIQAFMAWVYSEEMAVIRWNTRGE